MKAIPSSSASAPEHKEPTERKGIRLLIGAENYLNWSTYVMSHLIKLDYGDIVTGIEKEPDETKTTKLAEYRTRCRKAMAEITFYVSESQLVHIQPFQDPARPKEAWDMLKSIHNPSNNQSKNDLMVELFQCKMDEKDNVAEHCYNLQRLYTRLTAMNFSLNDSDFALFIVGTLTPTYHTLATVIKGREKLASSREIIAEIIRHKPANAQQPHNDINEAALLTKAKKGKSSKTCRYCNRKGHVIAECRTRMREAGEPNTGNSGGGNRRRDSSNQGSHHRPNPTYSSNHGNRSHQQSDNRQYVNAADEEVEHIFSANTVYEDTETAALTSYSANSAWCIDSGASSHFTGDRSKFSTYEKLSQPRKIRLGDHRVIQAIGIGNIPINCSLNGRKTRITITGVLHAPDMKMNLLSARAIAQKGAKIEFNDSHCVISKDDQIIAKASLKHGLYILNTTNDSETAFHIQEWHEKLGHLGIDDVKRLSAKNMVLGMTAESIQGEPTECTHCISAKAHRQPFPQSEPKSLKALDLVHSDLCGPIEPPAIGGWRYFMLIIDDFTRYTAVFFLIKKDSTSVLQMIKTYNEFCKNHYGDSIKTFRSDNGKEYRNDQVAEYFRLNGISSNYTVRYTPEQNGVSERANRTVVERAKAMLSQSRLPKHFWAEAVRTSVYLKNVSPTKALSEAITPYEAWHGKKPDIGNLRVFGCICYSHIPKELRTKLDDKTEQCIFLGYPTGVKGYRLYGITRHTIFNSRDVVFAQTHHPERSQTDQTQSNESQPKAITSDVQQTSITVQPAGTDTTVAEIPRDDVSNDEEPLRRSNRLKKKLDPNEYTCFTNLEEYAFVANDNEPTHVSDIEGRSDAAHWKAAMTSELNSIIQNKTWRIEDLPSNRKPIGCKWVFKLKTAPDGSIIKYKARLVAKGYSQQHGIDYVETFAPVARYTALRALFALSAKEHWHVHQMDVVGAFLNGNLKEEIYMEPPEGLDIPKSKALRLLKTLYGLKQSGREWYHEINNSFHDLGFTRTQSDHSVYTNTGEKLIIAIYVDDLLIFGEDLVKLRQFKKKLSTKFQMTDLGQVHQFLGMDVTIERNRIHISQRKYIESIIKKYQLENAKGAVTPMDPGIDFTEKAGNDKKDNITFPYQSAIGSLIYAMILTRPDIAFAVGVLSTHSSNPTEAHVTAVKRVIRYLKETPTHGLQYSAGGEKLIGFTDADYASDRSDRRSVSGCVYLLSAGAISWHSKKQRIVALSTTESEYVAAAEAVKEGLYLRTLFQELEKLRNVATTIFGDNQACIQIAKNAAHHQRTKHIDIRHHFLRQMITEGHIELTYIATDAMVADTLTKALSKDKFTFFRKKMGVVSI